MIVKPSIYIGDMGGAVGDEQVRKVKGRYVYGRKNVPTGEPSETQKKQRLAIKSVVEKWQEISPQYRKAWEKYAIGKKGNAFHGEKSTLCGYTIFMSINGKRAAVGDELLELPPYVVLEESAIPVGFTFFTVDTSFSPGEYYGGQWQSINGGFIACKGDELAPEKNTGTTLTVANLPEHTHTASSHNHTVQDHMHTGKLQEYDYEDEIDVNTISTSTFPQIVNNVDTDDPTTNNTTITIDEVELTTKTAGQGNAIVFEPVYKVFVGWVKIAE